MEQSKANSFTAYLREKKRLKAARQPTQGVSPLSLLGALASTPDRQMPVRQLQSASAMSFTDFAAAIKALKDSGYIALSGPPADEVAALTSLGTDVARLARPA